jgi:hypothetical protein
MGLQSSTRGGHDGDRRDPHRPTRRTDDKRRSLATSRRTLATRTPTARRPPGRIAPRTGHCCVDGSQATGEVPVVKRRRRPVPPFELSAFAGFRFPPEVIMLAVRWYLPLRVVLPRSRGAPRRAWHRRRSRHALSLGATVHALARRRRATVPACGQVAVVRG